MSAPAQVLVDADTLPERLRSFEKPATPLQCHVQPVKAALNLGFRFQTGYAAEIPLRQFGGEGRSLTAVVRVTPEGGGEPSWLASKLRVPATQEKKAYGEISGGYIVGEGAYKVDFLLSDDRGAACTATWNVRAKMADKVRGVRPGVPAGIVDDFGLRRTRRMGLTDEPDKYTVSILVNAGSTFPNRLRLRDSDRMVLLSALSSMADRLPAKIRLTLFSMDNHKELFHTAELTADSFGQAAEALNELELGKVDYSVLTHPAGHLELLARLLQREANAHPDAVIFLGPLGHTEQRVAAEALPDGQIPVYNVQLRPWRMRLAAGQDTISKLVGQMGGKTRLIYTAEDFAGAIQDIGKLLGGKEAVSAARPPSRQSGLR